MSLSSNAELQAFVAMVSFYMGAGVLNSGLAFTASAFAYPLSYLPGSALVLVRLSESIPTDVRCELVCISVISGDAGHFPHIHI